MDQTRNDKWDGSGSHATLFEFQFPFLCDTMCYVPQGKLGNLEDRFDTVILTNDLILIKCCNHSITCDNDIDWLTDWGPFLVWMEPQNGFYQGWASPSSRSSSTETTFRWSTQAGNDWAMRSPRSKTAGHVSDHFRDLLWKKLALTLAPICYPSCWWSISCRFLCSSKQVLFLLGPTILFRTGLA